MPDLYNGLQGSTWPGTRCLSNLSSFHSRYMGLFAVPRTCQACFYRRWNSLCLKFLSPRYPYFYLPHLLQISSLMSLGSIIATPFKIAPPPHSLPLLLSVLYFFLQYLSILNTVQFTYLLCIFYIIDLSAPESKFHKDRDFCLLIFQAPGRSPDIWMKKPSIMPSTPQMPTKCFL